jgi:hypothetical protein
MSLDALTGAQMSAAQAETNYSENGLTLLKTLTANKDAIVAMDDATAVSGEKTLAQVAIVNENNSALQSSVKSALDLASAKYAEAQATGTEAEALAAANGVLTQHRDQLFQVMTQLGYTEAEANAYIDRLGLTPENINTQVNLANQEANAGLTGTQGQLDGVAQGANAPVTAATGQAQDAIGGVQGQLAEAQGGANIVVTANTEPAKQEINGLERFWNNFTMGLGEVGDFLKGKASGGPVLKGQPYMVGERGPELFVPRTGGAIIPAGMTARMGSSESGSTTINVTIQHTGLGIDSPKLQRDLVGALRRWEKREGTSALGTG